VDWWIAGSLKYQKWDISWHIKSFLVQFFKNFLLDISLNYFFCLLLWTKKTRNTQISRSLINFQGKILLFMEFQVPLKWHFKLKHFSRSSRTCISHEKWAIFELFFFGNNMPLSSRVKQRVQVSTIHGIVNGITADWDAQTQLRVQYTVISIDSWINILKNGLKQCKIP